MVASGVSLTSRSQAGRRQRRRSSASPSTSPKPTSKQKKQQTKAKGDEALARTGGCTDDRRWAPWSLCLCLIISQLIWHRSWNAAIDRLLGIQRLDLAALRGTPEEFRAIDFWPLVFMLPLLGLAFHDMRSNPSKQFIHVVPDYALNYVLRVAGGYGIVQVLAQDLGIQTGVNQRNLVQHPIVQFIMLWGGAYAVTSHRSEGMVSALLYFVLKLNVSGNLTSNVCFEDV